MSLNESVILPTTSQEITKPTWKKEDTLWVLSLYGTAIGVGTLFLPINAGLHGIWPLVVMLLLAFPMTYLPHRAFCRIILSGSSNQSDITDVVEEHFGALFGRILTALYFLSIYPVILMYSVAITNTTQSFMENQLGTHAPPRVLLSILLILGLMAIVRLGKDFTIKALSFLVYPFAISLLLLSLYLIPFWNGAIFEQTTTSDTGFIKTLWLMIPLMVFSFNHSSIISSFAVSQKQQYGALVDIKSTTIMKYSHILMLISVMFFVFSCVFSLSTEDLLQAKQQNISILSYLANHFQKPIIAYVAPIIAFIAIAKSFLGHYLGAKEGLSGILVKSLKHYGKSIHDKRLQGFIEIFMIITCWVVATLNPNILTMIEVLVGPVIALLLFIMPVYAIAKVPSLKQYRHLMSDVFVVLVGIVAISAIVYGVL